MKHLATIFFILWMGPSIQAQTENPEPNKSPYLVESGRVMYKVETIRGEGTKELIFDNWGYNQRELTYIKANDTTDYGRDQHTLRIVTSDRNWSINLKSKAGLKLELKQLERSPLANARFQISGEPILGYKSMKVKRNFTTAWVYQGIILKLEIHDPTSGELIRRELATEIEIPYDPAANAFEAPKGVEFY